MTATANLCISLPDRALLEVGGADARPFLQGLVSNDVGRIAAGAAIHAALLTPQGKYLHDFFVFELGGALLLDIEAARQDDLLRRLQLYKLRSKVTVGKAAATLTVHALIGPLAQEKAGPSGAGVIYRDPRLDALGARAALPPDAVAALLGQGFATGARADYDRLRLRLGVPDGSRDLVPDKSLLMESGFDELHGIDFDKGCYIGQEITARMKHRALVKKRLLPVVIDGAPPPAGTPIRFEGIESGEMRSSAGDLGLAVLRLDHVDASLRDGRSFTASDARLAPKIPDWLER
jgi:folate-binding protein YgfZ